jgi:3-hydroxybutyryl-CoA dehydrogenase
MITTICVCGAGTMGSGIAQVAAQHNFSTILFDINTEMLKKAKSSIEASLNMLANKGKFTAEEATTMASHITYSSNIDACKADLVIEAIVEQPTAKISLFKQLAAVNNDATIYATNTSSLPVTAIAIALQDATRVAGMHFFNPAPVMKLVEVVKTKHTSPQVIEELVALGKQLGKTPVVCKDAPGFIVNRVARHFYLEALKLVETGVADVELIDQVLESAGFKMGPFKLMDLIGMDINFGVSNIVWEALGKPARLTPSPIQKQKVEQGELGRKSGKGFYTYNQ